MWNDKVELPDRSCSDHVRNMTDMTDHVRSCQNMTDHVLYLSIF